eukprot:TRINITY_DN2883_c0_g1_i7.p1 TRINITY_DN2883_c0_g1~~TRINITY_DN2883_c0_g1_i7.p1  ORF type:complete len:350 (+),score=43.35 TRINITY_DN2883_c0_g1_i7:479-1528(+)
MGMKKNKQRDIGKVLDWNQMMGMRKRAAGSLVPGEKLKTVFKWIVGLIFATYLTYAIFLTILHNQCWNPWMQCRANDCSNVSSSSFSSSSFSSSSLSSSKLAISEPFSRNKTLAEPPRSRTDLKHIVFGIAASARLWDKRKEYIKLWWRRNQMRGYVWVEKPVPSSDSNLPPLKISGNTSHFKYSNKQGHRSAIRLSRIVSETFRMGLPDVHWFVMGDDDTVFVVENLVRVLSKYDHNKFYYIGSLSESHLQNIFFSYGMAYGGGGFAISYPLAKALQGMQDECIQRYPALYGSDDRIQACMSELGVPLTKEPGFHQVCYSLLNLEWLLFLLWKFQGFRNQMWPAFRLV